MEFWEKNSELQIYITEFKKKVRIVKLYHGILGKKVRTVSFFITEFRRKSQNCEFLS